MPRITLTDLAIKRFPEPKNGTATYWDGNTRGLGLRISQGGTRTFVVLIGSGRRQALGRYPTISLSDARTEAKRILAEKVLGRTRPTHTAFDDAKSRFLEASDRRNRARTVKDYKRLLDKHYPFGRGSIADVTPKDLIRRLAKLADVPSERHHAFAAGRAFFTWCVRQHIIETSPMEKMEVPPNGSPRERVLTDIELAAVYKIARASTTPFYQIVALLILTGQRKGEISHLHWDWIDGEKRTITLPSSFTKNKRTHVFPFGGAVAEILENVPRIDDGPYVFPAAREKIRGKPVTVFNGFSNSKAALDKSLAQAGYEVEHWTLHDLRRTFSSGMAALRVSQTVVEKLLNHVSGGTLSPIAQVYNRYQFMDEMREAIVTWEGKLATLLNS